MKKLFLVYLILAALIACGENRRPAYLSSGSTYTLVVGLGETEGEGVVISRKGTGSGTRHVLALFKGKTPYRQRVISAALFAEIRDSFFGYYRRQKRRERLQPYCQLRLRSVATDGNQPGTVRSLCMDGLDSSAQTELGIWYRLVRSL